MPKLIPKKLPHDWFEFQGGLKSYIFNELDRVFTVPEDRVKLRGFAEEFLEKEEVQKSFFVVYNAAKNTWDKSRFKNPIEPRNTMLLVFMHCARFGYIEQDGLPEIYHSLDEAKKLARDIRRIKGRVIRLLGIYPELGHSFISEHANHPRMDDGTELTDKLVIESLDVLAGAFEFWSRNNSYQPPWIGAKFHIPKVKGKRKDLHEYSLVYILDWVFTHKFGSSLSPVIALLRNAVFPGKKQIDARRVREMLKELEKDTNFEEAPITYFSPKNKGG